MTENQQTEGVVKGVGGRLDKTLGEEGVSLSRTRLQSLIKGGHVTINKQIIEDASHKVKQGDVFRIIIPEAIEAAPVPQNIPLDILYEDDDLIVINKPAGMVVHPGAGNADETLVNGLLHHCKESLSGIGGVLRPGIVHRIDKQTSGILVVAKNDVAHQALSNQFSAHSVHRVYHALVWKIPGSKKGTVDKPIGRHPRDRQRMAVVKSGKWAVTHYYVLENYGGLVSLIECRLETGRTHQIRVHMASLGHPLLGDPLYGKIPAGIPGTLLNLLKTKIPDFGTRQMLHASELGFMHPKTGEKLHFKTSFAADFEEILRIVKNYGETDAMQVSMVFEGS